MYTVWYTDHEINQTITKAFYEGMLHHSQTKEIPYKSVKDHREFTHSISYGILRGTGDVFRDCMAANKEWWEIDRGYFGANHFDGYYRVSLNGTRALYRSCDLSRDRLEALGVTYAPWNKNGNHVLICPPSEAVYQFYHNEKANGWAETYQAIARTYTKREVRIRHKDSKTPLHEDLKDCHAVLTYNSNVAIDALRLGIPAISIAETELTEWNKLRTEDIESNKLYEADREALFRYLSYCQFTLPEMRNGYAWEKCQEVQKYA